VAVVLRRQQPHGEGETFALVCGSAINQDGRSSGLTAPNGPSQTALVRCGLQMQCMNGPAIIMTSRELLCECNLKPCNLVC